jgi:hypothetical protein
MGFAAATHFEHHESVDDSVAPTSWDFFLGLWLEIGADDSVGSRVPTFFRYFGGFASEYCLAWSMESLLGRKRIGDTLS